MSTPATSVVRYSRFFSLRKARTVLDYGAGTLRNAMYLAGQGFTVYAADVPEQVKVLRSHPGAATLAGLLEVGDLVGSRLGADLVLCTYVFNIILTRAQRKLYLDNIVANLRPGGYLLIEVNSRREEIGCGSAFQHYHCCDDKARSYTHDEFDRLLLPYNFQRICHYYSTHALAAIYQLRSEKAVT
ncbi:MAG TPA: tellurium resistance protein TehB [Geobacter sp.]|nr:tellurium resistance protein TehB [Geobacter sp.]